MMEPVLDFWFDFASTYSYPAAMRITSLARDAGVTLRFRPFLLGPCSKRRVGTPRLSIFIPPRVAICGDVERLCVDLHLPFSRPEPFPQSSLLAARVALVGLSAAWGEEFCRAVFRAEFCEGCQIDDPAVLGDILSRLHVEAVPVLDAARTNQNKARLREQTEEAQRLGIFGAPSFVAADGELFWGNDRLERALAWARSGR